MSGDVWDPRQYERFRNERSQPFFDLLGLVQPVPNPRVLDLGCGTGELTRALHERLGAQETLGLDSSPSMLQSSAALTTSSLRFQHGDIATFEEGGWDVLFSNAALQWLPDHPALFRRLAGLLAPHGQLAVQMPANDDHPSHEVAHSLAAEEPFRSALAGYVRPKTVLAPEAYAELLHALGFRAQQAQLRVYGHLLASRAEVVEWVKGTLLTDYQKRLPPPLFAAFLERYRERLLPRLAATEPYFYAFKRVLLWARR